MRHSKLQAYNRAAILAGLAMALGPLAALSIASQHKETLSERPVAAPTAAPAYGPGNRLARYDNKRGTGATAAGRRLIDIAKGGVASELFAAALQQPELSQTLSGDGPYTVFVPVDGGLSSFSPDQLASFADDPGSMRTLAETHIVPGRVWTTDLMAELPFTTLNGITMQPRVRGDIQINGATVLASDVAENGVVHFVSRTL